MIKDDLSDHLKGAGFTILSTSPMINATKDGHICIILRCATTGLEVPNPIDKLDDADYEIVSACRASAHMHVLYAVRFYPQGQNATLMPDPEIDTRGDWRIYDLKREKARFHKDEGCPLKEFLRSEFSQPHIIKGPLVCPICIRRISAVPRKFYSIADLRRHYTMMHPGVEFPYALPECTLDNLEEMRKQGMSYAKIAKATGSDQKTVWRRLNGRKEVPA